MSWCKLVSICGGGVVIGYSLSSPIDKKITDMKINQYRKELQNSKVYVYELENENKSLKYENNGLNEDALAMVKSVVGG